MADFPSDTVRQITEFLFISKKESELNRYDCVIFLGNDDISGNVQTLNKLKNNGHFTDSVRIILSGNTGLLNKGKESEAMRMFQLAVQNGWKENHFILECRATNCKENLAFSKELILTNGGFDQFQNILCIGRAFMLRRALMSAAALNYPMEKLSFWGTIDIEGANIGPDTWWKTKRATQRVMEELRRISDYTLAGDLSLF